MSGKESKIITAKVELSDNEMVMVNEICDKYSMLYHKYKDKVLKDKYNNITYDYILDENRLDIDGNIIYAMIDHINDNESSEPSKINNIIKTFRTKNVRIDYDQCIINDIVFSLPPITKESTNKKMDYKTHICYAELVKLMLYRNQLIIKIDCKDLRIRAKGVH